MDLKDHLTNEKVSKKFKSQFELVNYAIELAANMIHTGRDSRVKIDSQNRAMHVLTEIIQDKDRFDEIVPQGVVNETPEAAIDFSTFDDDEEDDAPKGKSASKSKASKTSSKGSSKASAKATDKKKPRKIIAV